MLDGYLVEDDEENKTEKPEANNIEPVEKK